MELRYGTWLVLLDSAANTSPSALRLWLMLHASRLRMSSTWERSSRSLCVAGAGRQRWQRVFAGVSERGWPVAEKVGVLTRAVAVAGDPVFHLPPPLLP